MVETAASGGRTGDLARLLEGLIEGAWLGVPVVAALLFNPFSRTGYEPDKAAMISGLLVVSAAAAGARCALGWRRAPAEGARTAMIAGGILLALGIGSQLISAALSVAPDLSWAGSYARRQGAWLEIGYLLLFAAAAAGVRSWRQWRRIRFAVAASSVPVCVLAILQRPGVGMPRGDVPATVVGTLGNSTFLAAYLVPVLFVTADLVAARAAGADTANGGARPSRARVAGSILAPVAVLVLQLGVLVMTRGRAAAIGLAVALGLLAIAAIVRRRDAAGVQHSARSRARWRPFVVGTVVLLLLGSVSVALLTSGSPDARIVRLASLINPEAGANRVRLLVWNAVSDAFMTAASGEDPSHAAARALLGHGQETTWLVLEPFHPPELARYESWRAVPDRAHGQTLEILLGRGVVGLAVYLLIAGGLLVIGLRSAGLLGNKQEATRCAVAMLAGSLLGAVLGLLLIGSLALLGVGLIPGMIVGAGAYLLARAPRDDLHGATAPPPRTRVLALLLTGALVAHLVETQLGIATTASEAHFWMLAGVLVALGCRGLSRATGPATEQPARHTDALPHGLLAGMMLLTLAFGFMTPGAPVPAAGGVLAIACVLGSLALWLAASPPALGRGQVGRFVCGVTLVPLAYIGLHWLQLRSAVTLMDADRVLGAAAVHETFFDGYHAAVLVVVVAVAVAVGRQRGPATTARDHVMLRNSAAALIVLALGLLLPRAGTLQRGRADILAAQAETARRRDQYAGAAEIYGQVVGLRPAEVPYRVALATVYAEWAVRASRQDVRDRRFRLGAEHLQHGVRVHPADSTIHANLARLYTLWGEFVAEPEIRAAHWADASDEYRNALELRPRSARYLAEWGRLATLAGDPEQARERFRRSLRLDPTDGQTYVWAQAVLGRELSADAAALGELGLAEVIAPAQVYGALIGYFAEAGMLTEAIDAALQLSRAAPDDPTGHRALAVLHLRAGNAADALVHARRAHALSTGRERREVARLLEDIESRRRPAP